MIQLSLDVRTFAGCYVSLTLHIEGSEFIVLAMLYCFVVLAMLYCFVVLAMLYCFLSLKL
jgi:hypothetical protein